MVEQPNRTRLRVSRAATLCGQPEAVHSRRSQDEMAIMDSTEQRPHDLWVGRWDEGGFLVHDPSMQLTECPYVYLFSTIRNQMHPFIPQWVKRELRRKVDVGDADFARKRYRRWADTNSLVFLESERNLVDERKEQFQSEIESIRREIERNHRQHLASRGLPFRGVREPNPRHHRVTHCWNCKGHLDNLVDVECSACGWIICGCGACGCGYSGTVDDWN